jgi:four helix bundle protein
MEKMDKKELAAEGRRPEEEKTKAKTFEDLNVWRKSHDLVLEVYRLTRAFPTHEQFGLTSQVRRAAVSIPANLAEGFKKVGLPDKLRYFNISQGSLEEVRYYLILTKDLGYADTDYLKAHVSEVGRMLAGYMKGIRRNKS